MILGAGPVDMTLALDLAARDIDVTIVEQHAADARGLVGVGPAQRGLPLADEKRFR